MANAVANMPRQGWQKQAACLDADLDLFFAPDGERQAARNAREEIALHICATCPVRQPCLEHALAVPEHYGIWGGLTEEQRASERRRRRRLSAA